MSLLISVSAKNGREADSLVGKSSIFYARRYQRFETHRCQRKNESGGDFSISVGSRWLIGRVCGKKMSKNDHNDAGGSL